jgi:thymidylate kinase
MLVSFEGQDGAGKTAILTAVSEVLQEQSVRSVVIEEFSDSQYGRPLIEAVARDKFLRPQADEAATHLTRALEEVIDLYYLDERVIGPALRSGQVVLKDRHYDTVLYTLVPMLVDSGTVADQEMALGWLRNTLAPLRHPPDLTIYVDAPLDVRVRRIEQRRRALVEANARQVSAADIRVFARREAVARQLIAEDRQRFYVLDNGSRPVEEGAHEVVEVIRDRAKRATSSGES